MNEIEGANVIACPICKAMIFARNFIRHFQFAHNCELTWDQHKELQSAAAKNPVSADAKARFLRRTEKLAQNPPPQIERTPPSMRGWDSNNPGRRISIGPLGPGKV